MKNQTKNILILQITKSVAIVAMATLFSCKNDISEVARVNQPDTLPSMYAREVKIAESEAGRIKYNLTAPILKRYESNQGAVIKFPEGFKVVFYDSLQPDKIRTEITAEFGVNNEAKKTMEASKNVIVINHLKGEKLNTEHLVWDQNTKKVYSEKFVTITTPDKILYGEGMESDEKFERWSIKKPRGEMYINEDK
ncbi:MAG: LPS export ABC transporter periplasmic protein LptC [Lentimicrobiaceae bacterium]|nr:LPS export ABC transporter periplasmic protein LptC [Lentimicrobiaceae bacterium]MCO5266826.1 LPS export ABC transporter periplasmic protein LptC [Lentimicrobium sp.]